MAVSDYGENNASFTERITNYVATESPCRGRSLMPAARVGVARWSRCKAAEDRRQVRQGS